MNPGANLRLIGKFPKLYKLILSHFTFARDSWNKERAEKDDLLKNAKLQLSQQQARAQEAEVSCLLGMVDCSSVATVLILRNFDCRDNLSSFYFQLWKE